MVRDPCKKRPLAAFKESVSASEEQVAGFWHKCGRTYHYVLLHHPEWGRIIHFLGVGALGFVGNLLLLTGLLWAGVATRIALMAGIAFSTLINFFGDRILVFAYARKGKLFAQLIGFFGVCFCGAAINYYVSLALLVQFEWLIPQIALIGGILVATVFNYLCLRYLVFRQHS
jgi:putative flippase GtrA